MPPFTDHSSSFFSRGVYLFAYCVSLIFACRIWLAVSRFMHRDSQVSLDPGDHTLILWAQRTLACLLLAFASCYPCRGYRWAVHLIVAREWRETATVVTPCACYASTDGTELRILTPTAQCLTSNTSSHSVSRYLWMSIQLSLSELTGAAPTLPSCIRDLSIHHIHIPDPTLPSVPLASCGTCAELSSPLHRCVAILYTSVDQWHLPRVGPVHCLCSSAGHMMYHTHSVYRDTSRRVVVPIIQQAVFPHSMWHRHQPLLSVVKGHWNRCGTRGSH